MKSWIDDELIYGNKESDSRESYIPRLGLYSRKANLGSFGNIKHLKDKIKKIIPRLCSRETSKYTVTNLLDCDGVAIYSEEISENIQISELYQNIILAIDLMSNDTRSDSSVTWVAIIPNNKSWLLLTHKSKKMMHLFLYSNNNIGSKLK
jgi:hypothetical protein